MLKWNMMQEICKKTSKKDVTPFDVQDQRLDGTEAEKFKVYKIGEGVVIATT